MPLSPQRANLIVGPAIVTRGTFKTWTKDDISLKLNERYSTISPSSHGYVSSRLLGQDMEASFTPAGYFDTAMIAALWGFFANLRPGTSLLTTADVPTTFLSADGTGTLGATAITDLPELYLGADDSAMGSMKIRGLVKTGVALSVASSVYNYAAAVTVPDDSLVTAAKFKQQNYTATYNGITFEAEKGWKIQFKVETDDVVIGGNVRDIRFKGIEVVASCVPVGHTPAELITLMNLGEATSIPGRGDDADSPVRALAIIGTDTTTVFTGTSATPHGGGFRWGVGSLRQNEISFYLNRTFTLGVQQPLFTFVST